ncbi:hypothetical protein F5141DRAFT_739586 [Pisolithus sp. B1]|nr:hypothetical protein F5141DRAFT_739586 [Pisolithus sp. B1]
MAYGQATLPTGSRHTCFCHSETALLFRNTGVTLSSPPSPWGRVPGVSFSKRTASVIPLSRPRPVRGGSLARSRIDPTSYTDSSSAVYTRAPSRRTVLRVPECIGHPSVVFQCPYPAYICRFSQDTRRHSLYHVSWDLLASLARLKTLRRLYVDFRGSPGSPLPVENDAFAGLRYLDTHIASLELSLRFHRWVPLDELRSLSIVAMDFARNDYSEDLEELLTLIPLRGPLLETIHVNLGFAPPRQPKHWVLTKSILTPYVSLRNLKVLDITLPSRSYSPQLTDDDLTQMAQSWPLLKELHLRTYTCGWALPTGLSLGGIVALIQHCPDIEGISLVFNAMEIPETVYHPDGNLVQNTRIRSLQVGNSPISSPENVATYLRLLMPGLLTVSTCNTMDSTHKMHWKAVSASLA